MSPSLVLSLWRERWGKEASAPPKVPYIQGKLNGWGDQLVQNHAWSLPGITLVVSLCCLILFFLTIEVIFTTSAQIIFSTCLVGIALYLRRYRGMLITLMLMGMSVIASTRYLNWRFNAVLGQDVNLDSILAFGLCLAELYLWIVTIIGFATSISPLKQFSTQLPENTADWPTVDIFITVNNRSLEAIKRITATALALEWPEKKLKFYLLDGRYQTGIHDFAKSADINYLVFPDACNDDAEIVNRAMSRTEGSLIALFHCDHLPNPNFLKNAVGWFIEDQKLGMIQTPFHVMAPEGSGSGLSICLDDKKSGISCALIRRSALSSTDKVDPKSIIQKSCMTLKLQTHGYRNALIEFTSKKNPTFLALDRDIKTNNSNAVEMFLLENQFSESTLQWKKRLNSLQEFLNFYIFVPRFIFFTAPLAYLLGGFDIIQAAPALLLVYFLPHLIHVYFSIGRLEEKNRFTVWSDLKEVILAWYFLLPTAASLLRTEAGKIKDLFSLNTKNQDEPFDWIIAWPYGIIFGLNLAGLLLGIQHNFRFEEFRNPMSLMCLGWVLCNLLLLMATLATAKESRHMRLHTRRMLQQAAMIQLPSGRTITGVTKNFPNITLDVSLPMNTGLEIGTTIGFSIFRGQDEFNFSAKVTTNDDQNFRVTILENSRSSYQELAVLALVRDTTWPKWLPGCDADRPLPKWLIKPIMAALGKVFATAEKLGLPAQVNRLVNWIKFWEKAT